MKKVTTTIIMLFALLLMLTGCAKQEFAVKVNKQSIPMTTYEEKLNASKTYYEKQGMDFSTDQGKSSLESIKSSVLEELIMDELIKQEVEKNKWDTTNPEVSKLIEKNIKSQLKDMDYQVFLDERGMTEEEVTNRYTFIYNIGKDVTVSDQEVQQYFESHYSDYGGQDEQVKASHVLVATEEEANKVIQEYNAGKDFSELAKEYSTDTGSKDSGGNLDYFSRGEMVTEFEDAAFSQKVGSISETPVKTKFGYHVILVEDHKEAVVPDFEKVKASVQEDALENAKNLKVSSYYSELRQAAQVEYAEDLKPAGAQ
ncbi:MULTISPECIES: peptidylprolyl isomerase [unclassified Dehalobacter]|uniref:peptidylprolyl isomerase n=1 Tax=unclassified Dehalobacter TaxID=2635733 RepID=UPI000E6B7223|nr:MULTISPECIES: peptidylprolyl isomerase [unclassified Dehalobacter]RJE47799.1 peptidylprolyl isomerase [Dehalobacter sp. MCB1]TCX49051.1 peptidylprolyl isomerase [Dehalobacter sp. 14DCB1]TCX56628.1 peptidylprolyl isomerase [Dehalobacter sp. 12DCB1]